MIAMVATARPVDLTPEDLAIQFNARTPQELDEIVLYMNFPGIGTEVPAGALANFKAVAAMRNGDRLDAAKMFSLVDGD